MKKFLVILLALTLLSTAALAETQILDTVRALTAEGMNDAEGERIDNITLEDGVLSLTIYLPPENAEPLSISAYAQGRAESIGEMLLSDDSLDAYWTLIEFDFPSLYASCSLGKEHVVDGEYGRYFDPMEIYAQIPD